MFVELLPLLGERTVMITVSRTSQNSIRVNFIPSRKKEDENAGLATPTELLWDAGGTGSRAWEEPRVLCGRESPASNSLTEAKAEMEAAAKAARDQVRAKAGQNAKKQGDAAPKEPAPESATPTEQNMTLFAAERK